MKKKKSELRRYTENTIGLFLLNGVVNNLNGDPMSVPYVMTQYVVSTLAFTFLLLTIATLIGKRFKRRNTPSKIGYAIKQTIVGFITILAVFSWILFKETETLFYVGHGDWLLVVGCIVMILTGIIPFVYVRKLRNEETLGVDEESSLRL